MTLNLVSKAEDKLLDSFSVWCTRSTLNQSSLLQFPQFLSLCSKNYQLQTYCVLGIATGTVETNDPRFLFFTSNIAAS